jgi:hypothetical protein
MVTYFVPLFPVSDVCVSTVYLDTVLRSIAIYPSPENQKRGYLPHTHHKKEDISKKMDVKKNGI